MRDNEMETLIPENSGDNDYVSQSAILFVDDEKNILSSLVRLFRPLTRHIHTATSGAEGLEILGREYIDLVISDMRMPEMDGATFLEKVAISNPKTMRILLTGYADMSSTIAAINKGNIFKYVSKPWDDNELKLTVKHALERKYLETERERLTVLTRQQNEDLRELNATLDQKVIQRTAELQQTMAMLEKAHESLKKSYGSAIKVFANLVEIREGGVAGHSRRVADQARTLAKRMGMDDEAAQQVLYAGLLHDIGRIGLPDALLQKPSTTLTGDERVAVNKHPLIGESALMALEPLQEAAQMIRHHHERHDGQGYPDGLKGNDIPLGARILAVVTDYDSLQSGTYLPRKLSAEEARDYINQNRDKNYDPKVVRAFLDSLGHVEEPNISVSARLLKSNGLVPGMVLARDLMAHGGVLLLSKGHVLDENLIRRIQRLEKSMDKDLDVYVNITRG